MQNYPTISVIIPAYNASSYIQQCIENMLAQTYKNLEIIIIDDGSTDTTAEIAKQYPVKLIRQQNQGAAVARNAGMDAASGEYFHFMDADDLINVDFYKRLMEAILAENADVALAGIVNERMPGLTALIEEKFLYINPEDKLIFTNVYHQGHACKYLFKASFLKDKKFRFDTQLKTAEDKFFSMQAVFFSNKIVTAPGTLYYYKERRNSLTTSSDKEHIKLRRQSIRQANASCENFVREHQIKIFKTPRYATFHYKFLGIWMFKKKVYHTGRVKWYLFGACILQRKKSPDT